MVSSIQARVLYLPNFTTEVPRYCREKINEIFNYNRPFQFEKFGPYLVYFIPYPLNRNMMPNEFLIQNNVTIKEARGPVVIAKEAFREDLYTQLIDIEEDAYERLNEILKR